MPIKRNGLGKGLDSLIPDKNAKSRKMNPRQIEY